MSTSVSTEEQSEPRIGRPPIYSRQLAEEFLGRVERGERVMQICAEPEMPAWRTVQMWIRKNPAFAARYARVREISAESLEHRAIEEGYAATDLATAAAARVRIDTLKWAAAKRNPRLYADKLLHTGGDGEGPIAMKLSLDYSLLTPQEMVTLRALIEKAKPKAAEPLQIEGEVEDAG